MNHFRPGDRFVAVRRGRRSSRPVVYTVVAATEQRVRGFDPKTGSVHIFWKDSLVGPWPAVI